MKTTTRIHASPVSDKNGQRPDTPAGFPARLASRWLDGLIAERGLSRNTVAAYRQDLDALRDFLDELETPLSGLDDENITLFIAWLRKRGDATRTLARRISSLRSFLAWCVERGELASNPAALIDTPKLPSLLPDVLTQDEIVRLLLSAALAAAKKILSTCSCVKVEKAFCASRIAFIFAFSPSTLSMISGTTCSIFFAISFSSIFPSFFLVFVMHWGCISLFGLGYYSY